MSDDEQKQLQQMFDAMGNSGARFVIGQVIGSQTNFYGDKFANEAKAPHTEPEEPEEPETQVTANENDKIKQAILQLKAEDYIKHLYDYTWVMSAMNDTEGLPSFSSPQSFVTFLQSLVLDNLPSESSIKKKNDKMLGKFPDLTFLDADKTESDRRINVGKRFLNIHRNLGK